ncbi:MAG: ABC transporter permease [Burkholderiales bacterium]|nr:ABC transporter permease [Burkholderiales bacterium]
MGRLASALLTLVGVSVLIFCAIRLVPGSFEEVLVPRGTPEFRAEIAARLGLDRPLPVQYGKWIAGALHGDFGLSLVTSTPVAREFASRLPVTGEIALCAVALAVGVGIPLGIAAGLAQRRPGAAVASRLFSGFAMSTPDFVLGSILLYVFSRYSLGLTVGNWVRFGDSPLGHVKGLVVPVVTLSMFGIGILATTTRHAVIGVLRQEHVASALLRGRSWSQVVRRHVLRNASIPVLTIASIYLGYLLGGAVLIENLFSIPGFGRYLFQGIQSRDYPVVQAGVLLASGFFVLLNMLTDIAYAALDPRMRDGGAS